MIHYEHLALSEEILQALAELNIDYVFQPIYEKDKKKFATCPFPNGNVIILCIFANSTWDISTKNGCLGISQIRKTIVFV